MTRLDAQRSTLLSIISDTPALPTRPTATPDVTHDNNTHDLLTTSSPLTTISAATVLLTPTPHIRPRVPLIQQHRLRLHAPSIPHRRRSPLPPLPVLLASTPHIRPASRSSSSAACPCTCHHRRSPSLAATSLRLAHAALLCYT
ncbi:hypothetical protein B0H14DRAFT_3460522 [Mycena olivaceomarginata]|nr:hypothetical protein B0H14DRAFT_3488567 [Mycena olivaceomarginata]KAJ7836797.1 hypothetical protein B0H14DRAFT_3460522 [Mycena olivaceomarginata]